MVPRHGECPVPGSHFRGSDEAFPRARRAARRSPRGRTGCAAWRRGPDGGADGTAPRGVLRLRLWTSCHARHYSRRANRRSDDGTDPGTRADPAGVRRGMLGLQAGSRSSRPLHAAAHRRRVLPDGAAEVGEGRVLLYRVGHAEHRGLARLAPIVPDRSIFRAIARNLAGELGYIREAAHVDLYEQFLDGLGISVAGSRRPCRSRRRSVRPRPWGSSAGRPSRRASGRSGSGSRCRYPVAPSAPT